MSESAPDKPAPNSNEPTTPVPPRYPPGYPPPPDYHSQYPGGMVPPPPVPPEAAAAAAAAGYPPMPYQPHPWPGYPPMPFPGMYPPPYGGYPPPYQQPPHMGPPPPHYYDPNAMPPGHYDQGQHGMGAASYPHEGKDDDEDDDEEDEDDYGAAARMKMYVKSKIPTRQEILDRRARKNAQSRSRAGKLRERMMEVKEKDPSERTEEEQTMLDQYENRRSRKNDRSRERAIEKKSEIERILNKPDRKRTKLEKQFLETALSAKQRKNEGDRLRRQRIKMMGKKGQKITGIQARGPYPGDPALNMSPLPPHHQYGGHPGYPPANYPSPRRPQDQAMSFAPPSQSYGEHQPLAGRGQLHLPQNSSQGVEQRRHPDGSMTISIGGGRPNEDTGDMMFYGENANEGSGDGAPAAPAAGGSTEQPPEEI